MTVQQKVWISAEWDIIVKKTKFLTHIEHDYGSMMVRIDFFIVYSWLGQVISNENQILKWFKYDQLININLLEADIPIVEELKFCLR